MSENLVPSQGALFGVYADQRNGRTHAQEMAYLEGLVGRTFDVDKMYYRWEKVWPSPHESAAVAKGRIPLVNWVSVRTDGTVTRWADIAAGRHDSVIRARADATRSFGHRLFVVFHHEPENDSKFGTAAEYRAAWRRIVSIFRNRGATNAVWTLNLMAYTFNPASNRNPLAWYAGDDVVDWIGANGYNWYGSTHITNNPWRSFKDIFSYFYAWGKGRGKPLAVLETGVIDDPASPQRKATWFKDAAATLKTWPEFKLVVYYNAREWFFDSSQASTSGYRAWGLDPYFNPLSAPGTDVSAPVVSITAPSNGAQLAYKSTVTIAASASDDVGVTKVVFRVNGTDRCSDTTAPYSCAWTVWTAPGKTNTFKATAYDAAENTATSTITVTTK